MTPATPSRTGGRPAGRVKASGGRGDGGYGDGGAGGGAGFAGSRYVGVGLVAVFAVTAVLLWAAGVVSLPGLSQVSQREPETTAELYFDTPTHLPTSYQPGVPLTFTWTLGSRTGHPRSHPFAVTVQRDGTATVLEQGALELGAGRRTAHTSTVTLPAGSPALVVVQIDGASNRIFFHTAQR
ncbi:hypothetical protein [Frankia sp. R82]|uniref:hypothetical protein n=1 Tax=Frankia sp. R82 TaxID=2950553 RepID=UPI0020434BB8|nr:hypothetical protein [Frankia sp. R82]MCM3884950.1 hypothetical protein [Frankia sp. R82]